MSKVNGSTRVAQFRMVYHVFDPFLGDRVCIGALAQTVDGEVVGIVRDEPPCHHCTDAKAMALIMSHKDALRDADSMAPSVGPCFVCGPIAEQHGLSVVEVARLFKQAVWGRESEARVAARRRWRDRIDAAAHMDNFAARHDECNRLIDKMRRGSWLGRRRYLRHERALARRIRLDTVRPLGRWFLEFSAEVEP